MDLDLLTDILKIGTTYTLAGISMYFGSMFMTQAIFQSTMFRHKINSQNELENIVKEESVKLGLDPEKIVPVFDHKETGSMRGDYDLYHLYMGNDCQATKATVRHELYHILKDCDRYYNEGYSITDYLFKAEPKSTLYGCFKIKL
ncbi:MAG: hypothetical protein ACOCRX_02190 [Candidatus Woesearchaeota archaeon]